MNNVFVYIEMEGGKVADVSLELLTKGRELATTLGVKLEAVVLGENLAGIEQELARYGADTVWVADDKIFNPFRTLPHTAVMCGLIEEEKPQIALFGATPVGRDFAPRVSSALHSGLTANNVAVRVPRHGAYTPTPAVSHAILRWNAGRATGLADGIVITPSHNPPRDGGYSVSYELFDLRRVANAEKKIPLEWITSDNAYVTDAFIDYCTPLLEGQTALGYEDGLPRFARLKKVFAK